MMIIQIKKRFKLSLSREFKSNYNTTYQGKHKNLIQPVDKIETSLSALQVALPNQNLLIVDPFLNKKNIKK